MQSKNINSISPCLCHRSNHTLQYVNRIPILAKKQKQTPIIDYFEDTWVGTNQDTCSKPNFSFRGRMSPTTPSLKKQKLTMQWKGGTIPSKQCLQEGPNTLPISRNDQKRTKLLRTNGLIKMLAVCPCRDGRNPAITEGADRQPDGSPAILRDWRS